MVRALDAQPLRTARARPVGCQGIPTISSHARRVVAAARSPAADSSAHVSRVPLSARRDEQGRIFAGPRGPRPGAPAGRTVGLPGGRSRPRGRGHPARERRRPPRPSASLFEGRPPRPHHTRTAHRSRGHSGRRSIEAGAARALHRAPAAERRRRGRLHGHPAFMSRVRGTVLAAVLFLAPDTAHAQGRYANLSFSATQTYDSNLFAVPSSREPQRDVLFQFGPTIEIGQRSPALTLVARYGLAAERYVDQVTLNRALARQDSTIELHHRTSRR